TMQTPGFRPSWKCPCFRSKFFRTSSRRLPAPRSAFYPLPSLRPSNSSDCLRICRRRCDSAYLEEIGRLKSQPATQLDTSRSGAFLCLQTRYSAERSSAQRQIWHSIIGVIEQIRCGCADPERHAFLNLETTVDRQRYSLRAGPNNRTD